MKDKQLLFYDRNGIDEFQKTVTHVVSKANLLITIFEEFQSWKTINTQAEFETLVNNPVQYFDDILLANVDLKTGGKTPDPEVLAELFQVDRVKYIHAVRGEVTESDCTACKKAKIRPGDPVLSELKYHTYINFLLWNGEFTVNTEAVKTYCEGFKVYIETEEQSERYKFWQDACRILNELSSRGYMGLETLMDLQKQMEGRLMFSYATNQLHLNEEALTSEILKIQ